MNSLIQDVRYALRGFRRTPGFAITAVLSLAIGIGVNSAIFSVASALLLRPLRYADSDRLVILWNRSPGIGVAEDWFSTAQYFDIRNGFDGFEHVALAIGANWNLTGDGEPERVGTLRVSSNLLPMLGVRPAIGDLFTADDDRPGRSGRALLSHGMWVRRYGRERTVVGRILTLNGQPYEIVGVLPEWFDLPREVLPTLGGAEHAEIVLPLPLGEQAARIRSGEDYNILAKLKPGVSLERAQAEMDAITARLRREHPDVYSPNGGLTFSIVPLQQQVVGDVRRSLLTLVGAVALVLVIACANVANLLLARAVSRESEVTVRTAIGASRRRLIRQFLTENVLLGVTGGTAGLALSVWMLHWIRALGAASVPRLHEITIDTRVLLFTVAVSLTSAVVFGLAPALRSSRLRSGVLTPRIATGGFSTRWHARRLLIVAEVALSAMLLVGAGLLIRSFRHLQEVPPGFTPSNVLTLELTMTGRKYSDATRVIETYRELWRRLGTLPGVTAAGGVSMLPLSQMFAWGPIVLEGRPLPGGESFVNVDQRTAAGDYFRVMQIPLLRGRLFTEHDTRETPRVVVVDDRMAQTLWPGEDPLGKRIRRGGMDADAAAPWLTVVGVVGPIKQYALDEAERNSRVAMYHPHTQAPSRAMNVVIRSDALDGLAPAAVRVIRELDPDLPAYNVKTMERRVDESLARRRFAMLLLALFAAVALILAVVGIYGVVSHVVSQGTRDIGIMMALGATPRLILGMVVRQGMSVTMTGLALGIAGAALMGRTIDSLLFEVRASDPGTFVAVSLLLTAAAGAGCYWPARRAARVEPMRSLRSE